MRFLLLAVAFAATTVWATSPGSATQPVEPLRPKVEQQIELLHPPGSQGVEEVASQPQQQIGVPEPVSPAKRTASNVGKVVLGITAAGIAIGAAMLSLLFL